MFALYYAGAFIGFGLLAADLLDLLRADSRRVSFWRSTAAAAATFVGLAPTLAHAAGYLWPGSGPTGFALAYLFGAATFLAGVLACERPQGIWLRRSGYLILLPLAILPSWVLIGFAPAIGLIGIGLVRPVRPSPLHGMGAVIGDGAASPPSRASGAQIQEERA